VMLESLRPVFSNSNMHVILYALIRIHRETSRPLISTDSFLLDQIATAKSHHSNLVGIQVEALV